MPKQQRKVGIKCASRHKNKEWQENQDEDIGGLWMHIYRNRQAIGQEQKNSNKANKLLIQSIQCRWNKEQRGHQGGISRSLNKQT